MPTTTRPAAAQSLAEEIWRSKFKENLPVPLPPELKNYIGSYLALDDQMRLALTSKERLRGMAGALGAGAPDMLAGGTRVRSWLPPLGQSLGARASRQAFRWSQETGPLAQRVPIVLRPIRQWCLGLLGAAAALEVTRYSAPHLFKQGTMDDVCRSITNWVFSVAGNSLVLIEIIPRVALSYTFRRRERTWIDATPLDVSGDVITATTTQGGRAITRAARKVGFAVRDFLDYKKLSMSIEDGDLYGLKDLLEGGAPIGRSALWDGSPLQQVDRACARGDNGDATWSPRLSGEVEGIGLSAAALQLYTVFFRRSIALLKSQRWHDLQALDHATELEGGIMHPVLSDVIRSAHRYRPAASPRARGSERLEEDRTLSRRATAGPRLSESDASTLWSLAPSVCA